MFRLQGVFMRRALPILAAGVVASLLGVAALAGRAHGDNGGGGEIPFDDLRIFFEFNSTDNDLGVQVFLDGEAWNLLKICNPSGRKILEMQAVRALGELGLTELFWESDEPSPEEVLALFPEGEYEFEGRTVEGDELEGEAFLSHDLPPAANILVPAFPGAVLSSGDVVIRWEAVPGIASYEVIVENEETGASMTVPLPASATTLHVPVEFLEPETEYKVEVLTISDNNNKTIVERVFFTGP